MTNSNWLSIIVVIILLALGGGLFLSMRSTTPVIPETATTTPTVPEGPRATYDNASPDKITVTSPLPGTTVGKSFSVLGKARGGWYFEASFPLEVVSSTGTTLALMPVQAGSDWMTSDFVPFATSTKVVIPAWYSGPAVLILRNDNPSGLPENAASVAVPILIQ